MGGFADDASSSARDEQTLSRLLADLEAEDLEVRIDAAKALGERGGGGVVEALLQTFQHTREEDDEEGELRIAAALALGKLGDQRAVEPLLQFLERELRLPLNSNVKVCWYVNQTLGMLRDPRAIPPLLEALQYHGDIDVQKTARSALVQIGTLAVPPLIAVLLEPTSWGRSLAVDALEQLGDARAIPPLLQVLEEQGGSEHHAYLRARAAQALGHLGGSRYVPLLMSMLQDSSEPEIVRRGAALGLGRTGDQRAFEPLVRALGNASRGLRWDLVAALEQLGDPRAVQPLQNLLKEADGPFRQQLVGALKQFEHAP
jgi:HEAT repeat protein